MSTIFYSENKQLHYTYLWNDAGLVDLDLKVLFTSCVMYHTVKPLSFCGETTVILERMLAR